VAPVRHHLVKNQPDAGERSRLAATFPEKLIESCILAGAPIGGLVLDPFSGAATTLLVAKKLNRTAIGIELSEAYCAMSAKRLQLEPARLL
jgi:DNA modification methylase